MKKVVFIALGVTSIVSCSVSDAPTPEPGDPGAASSMAGPAIPSSMPGIAGASAAGAARTTGAVGITRTLGPRGETIAMHLVGAQGELTEIQVPEQVIETAAVGGPIGNALQGCSLVMGTIITGSNTLGNINTTTVNCPAGQIALGVTPFWQTWFFSSACTPAARGFNLAGGTVDWFSTTGVGTGCLNNRIGAQTVCCTP